MFSFRETVKSNLYDKSCLVNLQQLCETEVCTKDTNEPHAEAQYVGGREGWILFLMCWKT